MRILSVQVAAIITGFSFSLNRDRSIICKVRNNFHQTINSFESNFGEKYEQHQTKPQKI